MEIRIYDREMNFIGVIENQSSFQWNRKYNGVGDYELHMPITDDNARMVALGNLVWFRGAVEVGVMESIKFTMYRGATTIVVTGRFAESYMDRRLIRPRLNFSGTVEDAMRKILDDAEPIPNVVLGDRLGLTDRVEFQATYKEVLAYEEKLAQSVNYGFRFRPNFTDKTLTFEIYQGVDHSMQQSDHNRVVFSESYGNLNEIDYMQNNQLLKNVAYVGGEGEGIDRTFITIGDDTLEGLDRREVFVDAKDVQKEEGMTDAEYIALLQTRGYEKLNEDTEARSIELETNPDGNFVYKRDYNVGDIVTIKKANWGIQTNLRVTAITEVYEKGYVKVVPTFGTPLATSIDWKES